MAAVANVAINLDSRGVPAKLKQIADRGKEVDRSLNGAATSSTRAAASFSKAGNSASQAAGGFNKLGKAIGGIITAAAALQALKFTIVSTAELETQTRSLKVLTGSLETAQKIVQQLQDIGAVTPFTSTELIDTAKRLSAFGVETEKLVDTTRRLGDVAGATGADLGGIATAFGQIQAKGRLQGEELLQLQERGIDLQSELQRMYGLTGEEFRKALEKGRFSAEAVDVALQNLTNTGGKYANGAIAQSDTLAGKFSTLQDGITRTAQALGQVLSPALQTILDQAIGVVNSINNALAAGRRIQQFGIKAQQRNQLFQQAGREAEEIALLRGGGKIDPATFTQLRDQRFRDLIERFGYETGQIQVETKAPTLETPRVPELLGGGGGAAARGAGAAKGAQRAAKEAERAAEAGKTLLDQQQRRIKLLQLQSPLEKRLLEIEFDRLDAKKQIENISPSQRSDAEAQANTISQMEAGLAIGESLAQGVSAEIDKAKAFEDQLRPLQEQRRLLEAQLNGRRKEEELIIQIENATSGLGDAEAQRVENLIRGNAALEDQLNQVDLLNEALAGAGEIIGNQLRGAIDGLTDGTADWNNILRDTLSQLGSFFLNLGLNQLAGPAGSGGILSFLGFGTRANGGPVNANQPYIVGERGPELFVPFQQGSITSNEAMQQASMAQLPFTRNAESISQATQTAQAMQSAGPINVKYESTVINGVEYVSAEQHRKGMAEAAERGRALTLQTLQNSVRTRSKVGL